MVDFCSCAAVGGTLGWSLYPENNCNATHNWTIRRLDILYQRKMAIMVWLFCDFRLALQWCDVAPRRYPNYWDYWVKTWGAHRRDCTSLLVEDSGETKNYNLADGKIVARQKGVRFSYALISWTPDQQERDTASKKVCLWDNKKPMCLHKCLVNDARLRPGILFMLDFFTFFLFCSCAAVGGSRLVSSSAPTVAFHI